MSHYLCLGGCGIGGGGGGGGGGALYATRVEPFSSVTGFLSSFCLVKENPRLHFPLCKFKATN